MGLAKLVLNGIVAGGLFIGGVYAGIKHESAQKSPYEIIKQENNYFLMEKDSGFKKIIDEENFQLGTLEEQVIGIKKQGPKAIQYTINNLQNGQ